MKLLISTLVWALNRVWPFMVLVVAILFLIHFIRKPDKKKENGNPNFPTVSFAILFVVFLLVVFFRSYVTVPLTYQYGVEVEGRVVSSETTNTLHKGSPVIQYDVEYDTVEGKAVESFYRTNVYNVWPTSDSFEYPEEGDTFTLRYLEIYPRDFIIINE